MSAVRWEGRTPSAARVTDHGVLARVLERAQEEGERAVVVFDLDSTLLDNRPRQAEILREFGQLHSIPQLAAARPEHWEGWELRLAMRNCGLSLEEVERWAEDAKQFWRDRFFTSRYCALDDDIAGAVPYVKAIMDTGAQLAYCTGRHEPMREGTLQSFARLGFPRPDQSPRVQLLMKPTFEQSDDDWKVEAYQRLRALGQVAAAFDNEPTHINGYRIAFPDGIMVHLDTDHSGREVELLDGIVSVPSFDVR